MKIFLNPKIGLFSFFLLGILQVVKAQIEDGSKPFSFSYPSSITANYYTISAPNKDSLRIVDQQEALEGKAYRFGVEYPLNANFYQLASLKVLTDKSLLWTLVIKADEALSLNFNFSAFYLKKGSKLWAYSSDKKQVYGAFTYRNINPDGNFAIAPIISDQVVLELYEPAENAKTSVAQFQSIVYGYRPISGDKEVNGYGNSKACNININCPEAVDWYNERNATVMLLTAGNTRKCTGTLINNTAEDGKAYILTANHCTGMNNSIAVFNYQSPDCNNADGPLQMRIQGGQVVANNAVTDFMLLKFNQSPLPNYEAFFAGWSRDTTQLSEAYCIHHPSTDIKKFSYTGLSLAPAIYLDTTTRPGANHWRVRKWTKGTTEGGSSGSALFNINHQIIGQLHGGYASCNQPNNPDYYGRFDYSWNLFSDSTLQLAYWLDPLSSNPISFSGKYHYTPFYDVDISLEITNKSFGNYCANSIEVPLKVVNYSKDTLHTFKIKILRNQSFYDYLTWIGEAVFLDTLSFNFSIPNLAVGDHHFTFEVESVNNQADEREVDNIDEFHVTRIDGTSIKMMVQANNASVTDTIFVKDLSGNVLQKINNFQAGTNQKEICVQENCYVISWQNLSNNLTKIDLISPENEPLQTIPNLSTLDTALFCYPVNHLSNELFHIYPVPNDGNFTLQINPQLINEPLQIKISDLSGRIVYTQTVQHNYLQNIQLQLSSGVYIVYARSESLKRTFKKKIIIY